MISDSWTFLSEKRAPAIGRWGVRIWKEKKLAYRLVLQVSEMCFSELTLSVCWLPAPPEGAVPPEVAVPLLGDPVEAFVPVISTLCPTCSVSLEVSPAS